MQVTAAVASGLGAAEFNFVSNQGQGKFALTHDGKETGEGWRRFPRVATMFQKISGWVHRKEIRLGILSDWREICMM